MSNPNELTNLSFNIRVAIEHGFAKEHIEAQALAAAEMLELLAPLWDVIAPMTGALVRRRVEERRIANERRMTDELAKVVEKLINPSGPRMGDQIEAARILDCYRDYRHV